MLWRFGFASTSSLDNLFAREHPPQLEELMDDPDILSEIKAQNNKLIAFLAKEDTVKSLLHWVVAGLDELDEEEQKSDEATFAYAMESPGFKSSLSPTASLSSTADGGDAAEGSTSSESKTGQEDSEADLEVPGLGHGLEQPEGEEAMKRAKYPQIATEILVAELWGVTDTIMAHRDAFLRPFWEAVLVPNRPRTPSTEEAYQQSRLELNERERARYEFWSEEDEERHRKTEHIRGLWSRVNAALFQKRIVEMVGFVKTLPDVVERMVAAIESPSIQDVLIRIVTAEEAGVPGVIDWLADHGLVPRLLAYLSPQHPPSIHLVASEVIKHIINLCAPLPFTPNGQSMDQGGQRPAAPIGTRDNRLIRELVSEQSIATMAGFMLDDVAISDSDWKAAESDAPNPADPFIIHPLPSLASSTSSLAQICVIIVELIRKNNTDYSEPHLWHTLRSRMMVRRAQHDQDRQARGETEPESEEDNQKLMETIMTEESLKLGIVHFGHLLETMTGRFGEIHRMLQQPRTQDRAASASDSHPLTNERFRIVELYAELMHASNMSILNRSPGTGPTYTTDGVLSGGLSSLDALGEAVGSAEGEEEPSADEQVTQARELPVSVASTEPSLAGSDDVGSDNDNDADVEIDSDDIDDNTSTPSQSPASSRILDSSTPDPGPRALESPLELHPPAPSQADVARLRAVMAADLRPSGSGAPSEMASVSHAAVASSTVAASSIADQEDEESKRLLIDADLPKLAFGDRLKQMFLQHHILKTVIDLFFEYPSNDFLHHVIYDLLQQVLNGRLTPGFNRDLVIEMITEANLIEQILDAQRANDRATAQRKIPRAPYMGHVILIAEELVKFLARCPADLAAEIVDSYSASEWQAFVDGSLQETKDRDARPLAGGKPLPILTSTNDAGSKSEDSSDEDDDNTALAHKFGEPLSRSSAKGSYARGFESYEDRQESGDEDDNTVDRYWRSTGAGLSGRHVDSSDEDDDDADWLRPGLTNRGTGGSDDDDFAPFQGQSSRTAGQDDFDDDDAWGNFNAASPSQTGDSANPFDDDFVSTSEGHANPTGRQNPLTPHDWASEFDREFSSDNWKPDEEASAGAEDTSSSDNPLGSKGVQAIFMPAIEDDGDDEAEGVSPRPGSSWSFAGEDDGEDLPPTLSPTIEQGPNLSPLDKSPLAPAGGEGVGQIAQKVSALSLTAPKDAQGQIRKAPPPPPASRSSKLDPSNTTSTPSASIASTSALSSSPSTSSTIPIPIRNPLPSTSPISSPSRSKTYSRSGSLSISTSPAIAISPPDSSLIQATSPDAPLGPGVSPDTRVTVDGMVQREVEGRVITVPADEIVRGVEEAMVDKRYD